MTIVNASALTEDFAIWSSDAELIFSSYVSSTATTYTYISTAGHAVTLTGTGFSVDASGNITAGLVDSMTVDLSNNGSEDISITGLEILGSSLQSESNVNMFWAMVLNGPIEVVASNNFDFIFAGDFSVELSTFVFGDDDVFGPSTANGSIFMGDAYVVGLNEFQGGNDSFDTAYVIMGDVLASIGGTTIGGDDNVVFTLDYNGINGGVTGDVYDSLGTGQVLGGNDLIDIRAIVSTPYDLVGDSTIVRENISITGGSDTVYGGGGNDLIVGDVTQLLDSAYLIGGNDMLYGGDGNDNIYGDYQSNTSIGGITGGNDELFGEGGNDNLFGNEGDDILEGGGGSDDLDGGAGIDTASYEGSTNRVVINMAANTATSGHATGDTFVSIENVTGSNFGDVITGNGGDNVISGGNGSDVLSGFTGDDHIIGGAGRDFMTGGAGSDIIDGGAGGADIARYVGSDAGVMINLEAGTATGGHANGDTLIDVEFLFGSSHDDSLTGDANNNWLYGDGGDDILDGGAGIDKLFGGAGADSFVFSTGDDFAFVTDWEDDVDSVDLSDYGYASVNDALANMSQLGAHVRFFDGDNTLLILNADLADMVDDIVI